MHYTFAHILWRRILLCAAIALLPCSATLMLAGVPPHAGMLTLTAYDAEGKTLQTGNAFFINKQGDAACAFHVLKGAAKAVVTAYKGRTYPVHRILGANSSADLVKFSTTGTQKPAFYELAPTSPDSGAICLLVNYEAAKKQTPRSVTVTSRTAYAPYYYYQVSSPNEEQLLGCPLLDANGQLLAITQKNVAAKAMTACAIDAHFLLTLQITATSALSADLRAISIPKALPEGYTAASSYLFMLPAADTLTRRTAYDDFVSQYPDTPDAYAERAKYRAATGDYAHADADFALALQKAEAPALPDSLMQPEAVHYFISDVVYRHALQQTDSVPVAPGWTLQRALDEARMAYALKPNTLYLIQQANCHFAVRQYQEAHDLFLQATHDPHFATPDTYFSAARSLELAGGDSLSVLALLDSVIVRLPQPVSARHAQYYLERAVRLLRAQQYRAAVYDYNEYEKAIGPRNLNERFYYLRYQAEMQGRMYQQALDDIRTAAALAADARPYRQQEVIMLLQVGEWAEAELAAQAMVRQWPDDAECQSLLQLVREQKAKASQK